jgi:hypothetical protein
MVILVSGLPEMQLVKEFAEDKNKCNNLRFHELLLFEVDKQNNGEFRGPLFLVGENFRKIKEKQKKRDVCVQFG